MKNNLLKQAMILCITTNVVLHCGTLCLKFAFYCLWHSCQKMMIKHLQNCTCHI